MSLSVVIVTQDEEANLARALESVRFAAVAPNEMIVLDSGSTDRTVEIARDFGARVFQEEWKGYAAQKNSAIDKAGGDWILALDADEVLEAELAQEIAALDVPASEGARPAPPDLRAAFRIPFKHHFLGQLLRFGGMYPDRKLRLFRRGHARFGERAVHESVEVFDADAPTGEMQHAILHYGYPTLAGYLATMDRYSSLAAEQMIAEGREPIPFIDTVVRPVFSFISRYIFLLGFFDGRAGLLFHYHHSRYVRSKYVKALALARKDKPAGPE
ncbi:MAG: glycosyltransferase family 2 protein [Acidobacteriota bacterium]|nr:glycosyltransferase family 2 protein [Acidobacteriota bacterium]